MLHLHFPRTQYTRKTNAKHKRKSNVKFPDVEPLVVGSQGGVATLPEVI